MNPRAVRGMKDIFGSEIQKYNFLVRQAEKVGKVYGYSPIETPIVEYTEVFQRSIGDETDVVSKEMYSFSDKGGESLTLRPEGTAGVIRAIASEKLASQGLPIKFMYAGPMFRYDRPQKGRYRQFHQIGFEDLENKTPYIDAIIVALASDILHSVGVFDFKIFLNTLGDEESKAAYSKAIVKYFSRYEDSLSEDSKRRLQKNPLRILDSKDSKDREICSMAPVMRDYLTKSAGTYFDKVCQLLSEYGIQFELDNFLVRGLDYYSHTAFEITADSDLGGSIGGGGRYDKLLQELGGPDISGIGFAFGAERVLPLISDRKVSGYDGAKFAVIPVTDAENDIAFKILKDLYSSSLRAEFFSEGSVSKKIKTADKMNCDIALIIGETEKENKTVTVKFMRTDDVKAKNLSIPLSGIVNFACYNSQK